jgi:hypothetical protein
MGGKARERRSACAPQIGNAADERWKLRPGSAAWLEGLRRRRQDVDVWCKGRPRGEERKTHPGGARYPYVAAACGGRGGWVSSDRQTVVRKADPRERMKKADEILVFLSFFFIIEIKVQGVVLHSLQHCGRRPCVTHAVSMPYTS